MIAAIRRDPLRSVALLLAAAVATVAARDYLIFLVTTSLQHMASGGDFAEVWNSSHTFLTLPGGYQTAPPYSVDLLTTAAYPNYPPTYYLLFAPLDGAPLAMAAAIFLVELQACLLLTIGLIFREIGRPGWGEALVLATLLLLVLPLRHANFEGQYVALVGALLLPAFGAHRRG